MKCTSVIEFHSRREKDKSFIIDRFCLVPRPNCSYIVASWFQADDFKLRKKEFLRKMTQGHLSSRIFWLIPTRWFQRNFTLSLIFWRNWPSIGLIIIFRFIRQKIMPYCPFLSILVNSYQFLSILVNSCQYWSIFVNSRHFPSIPVNFCQFSSIPVNSTFLAVKNNGIKLRMSSPLEE